MSRKRNKLKLKLKICSVMMVFSFVGLAFMIKQRNTYLGVKVYYNQEDSKWAEIPYDTEESTIGTSGCGVIAMAMVLSTLKDRTIDPVELANYSIENGYCEGYTKRQFFSDIINEEKYKLGLTRVSGEETEVLKELLSDGKHMAIAIMKPGHFTKEGHYIVIYGVEEIDGENYFKIMDPNMDNENYGNDGQVLYNHKKNGKVKASEFIFKNECDEYWIYSKVY